MVSGLEIKQKRGLHPIKWLLVVAILALAGSVVYFGFQWFMTGKMPPLPFVSASAIGLPSVDEHPVVNSDVRAYTVKGSDPRYISIPSIGIAKTRVFGAGLTKSNGLEAPQNIFDAAWYTKSATPGSGYGAVLINAHSIGYSSDGVFALLHKVAVGSTAIIERGDGKTFSYKVVSNEIMDLRDVHSHGMKDMMNSADLSKEGLSLVTNAGSYVPRYGQFDKRVMVRAVRSD